MNTTADRHRNQLKSVVLHWFEKSVTLQQSFRHMQALMGPVNDRDCLSVVGLDAVVSYQLTEHGGRWKCAGIVEDAGPVMDCLLGSVVKTLRNGKLPYRDGTFDVVVLDHVLEFFDEDHAFVEECHRVLKPTGFLVVQTPLAKPWSLLGPFRRLVGLSVQAGGQFRPGYSESELFSVLKDGFDVEEVETWSRFFVEWLDTLAQFLAALSSAGPSASAGHVGDDVRQLHAFRRMLKIYTLLYPFAWLGLVLDKLLVGHRGHRLAVRARRRTWKPRRAPTLMDGRSIADATINTKIGTAGPLQTD
jgi:SAM-dependent methyltransferase